MRLIYFQWSEVRRIHCVYVENPVTAGFPYLLWFLTSSLSVNMFSAVSAREVIVSDKLQCKLKQGFSSEWCMAHSSESCSARCWAVSSSRNERKIKILSSHSSGLLLSKTSCWLPAMWQYAEYWRARLTLYT